MADRVFYGGALARRSAIAKNIVKIHLARVLLLLNGRTDHVDLSALARLLFDKAVQALAIALVHGEGIHPLSPRGHLVDARDGKVAVKDQRQRARNGRCAHDEQVRVLALFGKACALTCAEAVLLVGHDKARKGKLHVVGEQGVRTDDGRKTLFGIALGECRLDPALLGGRRCPDEQGAGIAHRRKKRRKIRIVLARQDLGGGHEGALQTVLHGDQHGRGGAYRLAAAHVTDENAAHGRFLRHIGADLVNGAHLRVGQRVGKPLGQRGQLLPLAGRGTCRAIAPSRHGGAEREGEEFIVDQAPTRDQERLPILGAVNVPQSVRQ